MSLIKRMLKQKAVYWALLGVDAYGKPTLADPIEIKVRWEDTGVDMLSPESDVIQDAGTVYVDRNVTVGGKLFLGSLTSGFDPDPTKHQAWEIARFETLPNIRNSETLRTVHLMRQRG